MTLRTLTSSLAPPQQRKGADMTAAETLLWLRDYVRMFKAAPSVEGLLDVAVAIDDIFVEYDIWDDIESEESSSEAED